MNILPTELPGVLIIEPKIFKDNRGFFMESWNKLSFSDKVSDVDFVQDNQSLSKKMVLRGIHYQLERPQAKLVRVTSGRVFDVAVDLRKSSPYFGKWVGVELSEKNNNMLWIPPGFGHGFLSLEDNTNLIYKCSEFYYPEYERCICWNDPQIAIDWPLENLAPILSTRDADCLPLSRAETYA